MRRLMVIGAAAMAIAAPLATNAYATSSAASPWTGSYNTSCWYKMNLTQKGSKVTGTFTWYGGQVTGTVTGSKLVGKWSQPYMHKSGTFAFTLASTHKSFAGHWAYKGKSSKSCTGKKM
jgi:hypothetical protein